MVECADPDVASRLAQDKKTKRLCTIASDRHLVVPAGSEAAFGRAVRAMGYPLLSGERGRD